MRWYLNTILSNPLNLFNLRHTKPGQTWQVLNNLVLLGQVTSGKPQEGAQWGGNFAGVPNFSQAGNFQLPFGSTAIDAGVQIPSGWPDPLRGQENGKPDAGALPSGGEPFKIGRYGRLSF